MGKSSIDINGYRRQEANPISMVGVFPYTGRQIDYDGSLRLDPHKIYWVLRPPEELFHPEAIKSFNGLPIRIGHVMLGTGFKAVDDEPVDGCIYNVRQSMDMPEYLIGDFSIYTDKMKEVLDKGKIRELSLGYRCQYIPESGVYNGQPYEFKQANLRGNHLALVENGRCGSSVRVCDEAILTFDSLPEEIIKMNAEEKIAKAKKLADVLRNGDNTVSQDCLDFLSYAHDDRAEILAALEAKKNKEGKVEEKEEEVEVVKEPKAEDGCGGKKKSTKDEDEEVVSEEVEEEVLEPKAQDGCGGKKKSTKDEDEEVEEEVEEEVLEPTAEDGCGGKKKDKGGKAKDEIPPPPPPEEKPEKEEPPAKEPAPAPAPAPASAAPVAEPAPAPEKEPVPPPAPAKDGNETVTTPSIPTPVAGHLDGTKTPEAKEDKPKAEDAKVCDKCGKTLDACDCDKKEPKAEDGKEEPCKDGLCKKDKSKDGTCDCGDKEPKAEDGKGGITKEPMGGKTPFPEKEETFGESKTAMDGVTPDMFAKVAAECDRARKLALAVGQMGIAIDAAGKREIEVAREAVKQIPSLAFAVDAADEQVLMAVRGAIAARADELARARNSVVTLVDTPAVVQDAAPKAAPTAKDVERAFAEYFG